MLEIIGIIALTVTYSVIIYFMGYIKGYQSRVEAIITDKGAGWVIVAESDKKLRR